jgi:hypothetical protein
MERRYVAIDGLAMATSQRPGPRRWRDQAIQQRRGMSGGLTKEGIHALDTALERHVGRGDLPGLVTSPEPTEIVTDFWAAAYAPIDA